MTIAPSARKKSASAISALLTPNAGRPSGPSDIRPPFVLLLGDEACALHQGDVPRFLFSDPVGVFLAGERGLVERALLHERLPFRRLAHFLEYAHVVVDVLLL